MSPEIKLLLALTVGHCLGVYSFAGYLFMTRGGLPAQPQTALAPLLLPLFVWNTVTGLLLEHLSQPRTFSNNTED